MDMFWVVFWLLFAGIIAFMIYGIPKAIKEQEEQQKINLASENPYLIKTKGVYQTGLPDILPETSCEIRIHKKTLEIDLYKNGQSIKDIKAPINKVYNAKIATEEYIREKIHLGKLVAFGIFSLGMKKKKIKEISNYLEITFRYDGEKVSAIFSVENENKLQEIVNHIRGIVKKRKEVKNRSKQISISEPM